MTLIIKMLRLLLRRLYGFQAYNEEVLKTPGPVILIPNHVSWFDWLFLGVCLEEDWKFVVSSTTAQLSWLHRLIMVNRRTLPVDTNSPYAVKRMAEHLQAGGRLVLFAEGRLSRTGTLMKLFDGTGFLLLKTQARLIPAYLRGAKRMPLSPNPGLHAWFPKVTAHFGEALMPPKLENLSTSAARTRLTDWVRDQMVGLQFKVEMEFGPANVLEAIRETAAERPRQIVLEDGSGQTLTYRRLLTAAEALGTALESRLAPQPARVGVLLPNVNGLPVLLLSLWSRGRIPAVLNYSTGPATMLTCARLAGLKQIITSRVFIERAKLKTEALKEGGVELLYLEDIRPTISSTAKLAAALKVRCGLAPKATSPEGNDPTAVILFTSGSEGVPKGVELTHTNLLANMRQMLCVADITDTDRMFNCLPLFHSFGLTVGTLLPLVRGLYVFIYPSPLHYRMVPAALYERDCTVFLSTNTFLNGYGRKAHAYDFRSLRYLFAAAEKLQEGTAAHWCRKFGVRVLEGFGATECAPCLSVNTPVLPKYGSVGRLLPGVEYKLEPVPGVEEGGRLFVRGPNVMRGYCNPEANAKFKELGGWYDTGDIVSVDEEGYLFVRGRLKRFAKISGEMVSLTAVEDALSGAFPKYGLRFQVAVVSRPDEDKGEALVAVSNEPKLEIKELREALLERGLSPLSVPREIKYVREIPKLGTGKVNHRELTAMLNSDHAK